MVVFLLEGCLKVWFTILKNRVKKVCLRLEIFYKKRVPQIFSTPFLIIYQHRNYFA